MNAWLADWLPMLDLLGCCLLHFLWQGVAIGLLYAALRPICASSPARYRLAMSALFAMAFCPLVTFVWLRSAATLQADSSSTSIAVDVVSPATSTFSSAQSWISAWQWQAMLPWLAALWLLCVCMIITRSFLHWRRLARVLREAVELPAEWRSRLLRLSRQFGVSRSVRLISSWHVRTPMLVGWLKPTILLPMSLLTGFTPMQLELIVAHELSHVRRWDYLTNIVQVAIETLLFYHPCVHWISREARQAREQCCDDLVLTIGRGEALIYARTLADLEELKQGFGAATPALGAGGGALLARIRRIVDPTHALTLDPLPRDNALALPLLFAAIGFAFVAMLRLQIFAPSAIGSVLRSAPIPNLTLLDESVHLAWDALIPNKTTPTPLVPDALTLPARTQTDSIVAAPAKSVSVDRLARPRIASAVPVLNKPRVADLPTRVAESAASIAMAALPVAPDKIATIQPTVATPPSASAIDGAPIADRIIQARYPFDALRSGITGKVDLDFRIDADGKVSDIRVLHAQPAGVFDQAAIAALRQWHFSASAAAASATRYARSFAFTHADPAAEKCREVTGTHICRRPVEENASGK